MANSLLIISANGAANSEDVEECWVVKRNGQRQEKTIMIIFGINSKKTITCKSVKKNCKGKSFIKEPKQKSSN